MTDSQFEQTLDQIAFIRTKVNGMTLLLEQLAGAVHGLNERVTALEAEHRTPPTSP